MTTTEQIEYLATRVMGWEVSSLEVHVAWCREKAGMVPFLFNPTENWNHWRWVEEKVMEDEGFFYSFLLRLDKEKRNVSMSVAYSYCLTDLPTRVSALIAAHQELFSEEPMRGTDEGSCSKSQSCSCMNHD